MSHIANGVSHLLTIGAVERDTGLSKDVLRVWERRYGFPKPGRDANGERVYEEAQVERLRMIRRLMDSGYRPGKLLAMPESDLNALERRRAAAQQMQVVPESQKQILALIAAHDSQGLRQALSHLLAKQGIQKFTIESIAVLNRAVGESWIRGETRIFEEHMYTEAVLAVMYAAFASIPRQYAEPRILLSTLPNEQHSLGLLMAETLLASEGANTVSLGTQLPTTEIASAALAYRAQIVCLSFSTAYATKQAVSGLRNLRELLPKEIEIWVGGDLAKRIRREVDGVKTLTQLTDVLTSLRVWRAQRFANTEAAAVIQALTEKI
jgi:MerR family transcriptional regulator, light-induced transcriptional regulator